MIFLEPRQTQIITNSRATEALKAIVPVVKVSLNGTLEIIGTAFFISTSGIVVTAKHVLEGNINKNLKKDMGEIGVFHTYGSFIGYRPLYHSSYHSNMNIAISKTRQLEDGNGNMVPIDGVLPISLLPQRAGDSITSQFFHDPNLEGDQKILNKETNHMINCDINLEENFHATKYATLKTKRDIQKLHLSTIVSHGSITDCFPEEENSKMLPFEVFKSNMPTHGVASGGPVFNAQGEVTAINIIGHDRLNASFHANIFYILDLVVKKTCTEGDSVPRDRTIREIAALQAISISGL